MKIPITPFVVSVALAAALPLQTGWAQEAGSADNDPCASLPDAHVPQASISNGLVHAVIYLPDPIHGYYRSTRFDWAGVIPCLAYKGHTYFGAWSPNHNPLVADSIAGPVEEFRSEDGSLGYGDAKNGGL